MMIRESKYRRKVIVVGAGAVGSTYCYALAQSGLADEIALIDRNESLARGQVLDLAHGQPYFPTVSIHVGTPADYTDAKLIVITAGAAQRPGETRMQLLQKNAAIMRSIVADIVEQKSSAVILVVSNPVDIMTYIALQSSGWDNKRIIGSGTVLDSARLRYILSEHCKVDVHNVHGYVLGEHGDSEFVAWSLTNIAGMPIDEYCKICKRCDNSVEAHKKIEQKVRDSAYHIIDYKGATYFAVGLALIRITAAVLRGQNSVLSVSTMLKGEFGLRAVCLSVPCLISETGVKRIIEGRLNKDEITALYGSAAVLKEAIDQLEDTN